MPEPFLQENEPRLPADLERVIFEMAAFPLEVSLIESGPQATKLMLVAKRVYEW